MPKGVYPHTHIKPRVYPADIVAAVRRMYLDEGMTVREVQDALPKGYKAQRIIERHVTERRAAAKRNQRGELNHAWRGDDASYGAVHLRLGKASASACADCGEPANDWSYEGGCPSEQSQARQPFCTHPEHYQPRCTRCHHHYDFKGRRPNGQFVSAEEVMPHDS